MSYVADTIAAGAGIDGVAGVTGFAGASPKIEYLTVLAT